MVSSGLRVAQATEKLRALPPHRILQMSYSPCDFVLGTWNQDARVASISLLRPSALEKLDLLDYLLLPSPGLPDTRSTSRTPPIGRTLRQSDIGKRLLLKNLLVRHYFVWGPSSHPTH